MVSKLKGMYESRITEDYLVTQVNSYRQTDSHDEHKKRIEKFDSLYRGDMSGLFPGETGLGEDPLVENKAKNATHDLARLASEARGAAVFMRDGEGKTALKRTSVRAAIAETIWHMARGKRIERKLYLDLISTGITAISVYYNDSSDYPIFMRLNPRNCYPDVHDGQLQNMLYVESMKERQAAMIWPDLGLKHDPKNSADVLIVQWMDDKEVVQAVCSTNGEGEATKGYVTQRWEHDLKCVPVAFVSLDSADDRYHGLFDQLGGPLMIRNKIIRLMTDYMESMVHAPFEYKGIMNAGEEPGPLTKYEHDDTRENDTFIRRVAPAAPAGSVFGLLQYMNGEESAEAIQPPARVGVVRQSIASGSFVDSTQGTLSSVIFELQDLMADLRYQANYIAFKIDAKYLNKEKPLWHSVGNKNTYTPKDDMGDFYYHSIQYGAAAGLNRAEAGVRVLQDLGAGLIDKQLAREQVDYIDDVTSVQDRIDKEQLANVFFQRFSGDPNTPMSLIATALTEMAKGKTFLDVLEMLAPEIVKYEKAQQAAAAGPAAPEGPGSPAEEQAALEAGATGAEIAPLDPFAPPPLNQTIIRGGFPS